MATYQSICPRCNLSFASGVEISVQLCNTCIQTQSLERMNADRAERDSEDARRREEEDYRRQREHRREEHEREMQRLDNSKNKRRIEQYETYPRLSSAPRVMSRFESIMHDRWDEWRGDHERLKQLEYNYHSFSRPEVKKILDDFRDGEMRLMQRTVSYTMGRVLLFISMLMILTTPFFLLAAQFLSGVLWLAGGIGIGLIFVALLSNKE